VSGYRYGRFNDGPDPLAAPPDVAAGVDEIAQRVMNGQSIKIGRAHV
jgi:uncharacterized protein with von Willebrand factor type A (vWA) domain